MTSSSEEAPRWRARLGAVVRVALPLLVAAVLLFAAWRSASVWKPTYEMKSWVSLRYLKAIFGASVFALACTSMGHVLLRRVIGLRLPLRENLVFAFPLGMLAFFLAMFTLGTLGLLGRPLFFALPAVFIAAGAPSLVRLGLRLRGRRGLRFFTLPPGTLPFVILGVLAVVVLYIPLLTPWQVSYDGRWYHLRIAEHYVGQGKIAIFPEGWTLGAIPHLASILYTWAFLIPGDLFDRTELSAHMELVVFLATLPAIPALVRAVVPRASGDAMWPTIFLFPTIFVSCLQGSSDHIAAVFTIPAVLALFRSWRSLDVRPSLLTAAMISGLIVTKMTALSVVAPVVVAVVVRALVLALSAAIAWKNPLRAMRGAWVMLAAGLVLTSPYWLRNYVYYGNPIYPTLQGFFHGHPWHEDATEIFEAWSKVDLISRPEVSIAGLKVALKALLDIGTDPHDLATVTAGLPIFGTLFTLMAGALPFLRARARLWGAFAIGAGGIFVWMWILQQERYLQTVLPLVAAATAAALVLVWRAGVVARLALAPLLVIQIAWSVEACFISQDTAWVSPLMTLLHEGPRAAGVNRFRVFTPWSDIAKELPRGAKVLVHEVHDTLGLRVPAVYDFPQWQFGISYARLGDARSVYDRLRSYGVTHLAWRVSGATGHDTVGGDLAFFRFATKVAGPMRTVGSVHFAPMPATPPPPVKGDEMVAYFGCGEAYATGLYALRDLHKTPWTSPPPEAHPPPREPLAELPASAGTVLERATFLIHRPDCGSPLLTSVADGFVQLTTRGPYTLYLRK